MAHSVGLKTFTNKYVATGIAILSAGLLALHDGKGAGGLLLWPLFGATNQLLASLALLVVTVYLSKKGKPIVYTIIPFVLMLFMTGWAMIVQLQGFCCSGTFHLAVIGVIIIVLEIWMVIEALLTLVKSKKAHNE